MERWKDAYKVVRAVSNDTKDRRLAVTAPAISRTCRIVTTILLLREGNEFLLASKIFGSVCNDWS
jgi:hypothetical protein